MSVQGSWWYLGLLFQYAYCYFCLLLKQQWNNSVNISTMIVFFKQLFQTNPCFLKSFPYFAHLYVILMIFQISVELFLLLWNGSLYLWRFSVVSMFTLYDNVIASKAYYTWCLHCRCSVVTVCDPWTAAHQASLSFTVSRS